MVIATKPYTDITDDPERKRSDLDVVMEQVSAAQARIRNSPDPMSQLARFYFEEAAR